MENLAINIPTASSKTYQIFIGKHLIEKIAELFPLQNYSKIVILSDGNIAPHFLNIALTSLPNDTTSLILKPGEKEKDIESLQNIWAHLLQVGADRKSLLINLGGGVISDIGGFGASTYMRGIDFINIPTTLLSQIDASVGGKTGFDFSGIKNLIGTFAQPKAVIIDVDTLKTLPKREFLSGFAEIIKHGIIKDKKYFEKVTRKKPLDFSENELIDIIKESCEIKAFFVENDEKESGLRKTVNFGHTIGHAIEALSLETNIPLLHGEAISIGMVLESTIAQKIGLLPEKEVAMIEEKLKEAGLPTAISTQFKIEDILEKMRSDKKNTGGKINFTLIKHIGEAIIDQTISETVIKEVLKK